MINAEYQTQDILVNITYQENSFYDNLPEPDQHRYLLFLINHLVRSQAGQRSSNSIKGLHKRRKII